MRLSARQIAKEVGAQRLSAVEVARRTLARIAAYDEIQPQTWISRPSPEVVLAQAALVDQRIAAGEELPLAGAPFAVKDNIDVAGSETTAGCPTFAYRPEHSAEVVERLVQAGAIMVGKTNLDQFATGLVGTRSPYGAPGCVFNQSMVSGGSSSGSAVAVAAGLVAFALGTDTAGSGRVPAAFNHLIGLKPSRGRWSTRGLVPACRSLDCISVFASELADAALVDETLAVFDPTDPYSRRKPALAKPPGPARLGIPRPEQLQFFGDMEAQALHSVAVDRARAAGFELVEVDIEPLLAAAKLLYSGAWVAERAAAIEPLLRARPSALEPTVRAIIQGGLSLSAIDAFRGAYDLQALTREAEGIWTGIDALLLPTTPTAYAKAAVAAEPYALNANLGLYTNFVNLLDLCALAVPAGFRGDGVGQGVTFIAPAFADRVLTDLAARYLETFPMTEMPPLDLTPHKPGIRLAVVGAHLSGMPLHWQLTSRNARLIGANRTASAYRLYAMAQSTPPKPALAHVGEGGQAIELEIYELETEAFGSFVAEVPPPLAIGTVTLEDGSQVKGFVAEPRALDGAADITAFGGWRAYIDSLK
ncbi:MAG: allophanate hydrolase [Caulobacteraceae bacterium]|nr:allophanate hydrolase [Caulobacteraceae bacterium]